MTAHPSFTGLNPHLVASFFVMKRKDNDITEWEVDRRLTAIQAPLTQAGLEISPTWQSPFEGAGIESKAPAIAQMAQAGMFSGLLEAFGEKIPLTKGITDKLSSTAAKMVGKSGVTKLNSTQVFSGMPPIKIQVTAFFRAMKDPLSEVENPLRTLQEWAMPQVLAKDGLATNFLRSGGDLSSLMPSTVPLCIGMTYKGRTFMPLVIESINDPLDAPIDLHGRRISAVVQMTLCSLSALDRKDWQNTYRAIGNDFTPA